MPAGKNRPAQDHHLSSFARDERHDGDCASAFDGDGQLSLVTGAITRDSSGHNFPTLCDKIIQDHRVFIVNFDIGIRAEAAKFLSVKKSLLRGA